MTVESVGPPFPPASGLRAARGCCPRSPRSMVHTDLAFAGKCSIPPTARSEPDPLLQNPLSRAIATCPPTWLENWRSSAVEKLPCREPTLSVPSAVRCATNGTQHNDCSPSRPNTSAVAGEIARALSMEKQPACRLRKTCPVTSRQLVPLHPRGSHPGNPPYFRRSARFLHHAAARWRNPTRRCVAKIRISPGTPA